VVVQGGVAAYGAPMEGAQGACMHCINIPLPIKLELLGRSRVSVHGSGPILLARRGGEKRHGL
jgi:hypothetical protein